MCGRVCFFFASRQRCVSPPPHNTNMPHIHRAILSLSPRSVTYGVVQGSSACGLWSWWGCKASFGGARVGLGPIQQWDCLVKTALQLLKFMGLRLLPHWIDMKKVVGWVAQVLGGGGIGGRSLGYLFIKGIYTLPFYPQGINSGTIMNKRLLKHCENK